MERSKCRRELYLYRKTASVVRIVSIRWPEISLQVSTKEFDSNHLQDRGYISAKIRETLVAARNPEFIANYISVAGHQMMLAAEKEEHFFFGSDHTTLSMNSNASYVFIFSWWHILLLYAFRRLHWQSANFGSSHARFFTSGITRFYLRVFTANPSDNGKEALDVTFGAPASLRQGIIERLGSEFLIM